MWRWLALVALVACNPYEDKASELSGLKCREADRCNGLVFVDCDEVVDGPQYYFDEKSEELIVECAGFCNETRDPEACETLCPPPQWTCPR